MLRRLGIAALVIVAVAGLASLSLRTEPSNASVPGFGQVTWGDSNCDDTISTTDVLFMLSTFTHYQSPVDHPGDPITCPRTPQTVFINATPYLWSDFNCSGRFDYTDVIDELLFLVDSGASLAAEPQGIDCFDYLDIIEPVFPPVADDSINLAIDTNTSGNAATSLGPLDTCRSVSVGETFTVDAIVLGIPPVPGIIAFDHDFRYNPAVLDYISNDPYFLIAANNGPSHTGITDYTDFGSFGYDINTGMPIPGTPNGHIYPTVYDYSYGTVTPESGDGVLIRYTLKAKATGTSSLQLRQILGNDLYPPTVGGTDFETYEVDSITDAEIRVGNNCPGVTPTPTPIETLSPTPTPTSPTTATASPTPSATSTPDPTLSECPNINPTKDIDDNDPVGFDFTTTLNTPGTIERMAICLNIAAQWAGDVIVTITHDDGVNPPHTRTLIERVGNSAGTCSGNGNGFYVYLTDDPTPVRSLEDACPNGLAGDDFEGEFFPTQPLADDQFANTFFGESIAGDWIVNVSDNQAGGTVEVQGIELHITAAN